MSRAPGSVCWQLQTDATHLASALANALQSHSAHAIAEHGVVRMGLAGGSTPMAAYGQFARAALPWQKVHATLLDERAVPPTDAQSNQRAIAAALGERVNQLGVWQGLYAKADSLQAMAEQADNAVHGFGLPLDVAVIGMGDDGHIASLFVESADYADAIRMNNARAVVPIRFAANEGKTDRLSFTLSALLASRRVLFCVTGSAKREVLEQSLSGHAPHYAVARFLAAYHGPVDIFWSPT